VSAAEWLTADDLGSALSLVEDGRYDGPGPIMPWSVFNGIAALVPAEMVSFANLDYANLRNDLLQGILDGSQPIVDESNGGHASHQEFWDYKRSFWAPAPPASLGRVRRWSDFYTPRELREQPLYAEFFGPSGVKHFMSLGFPALPGRTRTLLFFRTSGDDFNDRDKLLLQLLRPHLYELDKEADRRRQGLPTLTRREWQVLELVAQGYSNADIGRLLFTSVSTVRKHLEHIFDHAGVRSRSAAVARMMPLLHD